MKYLSMILFLFLVIPTSSSYAANDSFRCGSDLISLGETMYEVESSCGEPYTTQIVGEKTRYRLLKKKRVEVESSTYVTEWVYKERDGIYILTFEGSKLVRKEFIFQ